MKISYLGCASLGEVTPIEYGELTNLLFWQITNADKKDGFFLGESMIGVPSFHERKL